MAASEKKKNPVKNAKLPSILPNGTKENSIARRYREMIAEALLRLMEEDDYNKISITQICQEAQIARQTFYHHFNTKNDVIQWYLYIRFLEYTCGNPDTGSMEGNIRLLYKSNLIPKRVLLLLKKHNLIHLLLESTSGFLEYSKKYFIFPPLMGKTEYTDYQDDFIANVLVSVLYTWINRDFSESPEELTSITCAMLSGINPE